MHCLVIGHIQLLHYLLVFTRWRIAFSFLHSLSSLADTSLLHIGKALYVECMIIMVMQQYSQLWRYFGLFKKKTSSSVCMDCRIVNQAYAQSIPRISIPPSFYYAMHARYFRPFSILILNIIQIESLLWYQKIMWSLYENIDHFVSGKPEVLNFTRINIVNAKKNYTKY